MAIKAVIFDLGGVIFHLGEEGYRREVARRLGLGDSLPPAYEEAMPAIQRGEVAEQDVWEALSGRRVPLDAFDDAWQEHFTVNPEMLALAAELRERGVRTAVLSNTQASHVAIMRRMGVLAPFGPVLMSCEVGRRKPEPEVFQLALEMLGLPADEVAFVDDVPEYVAAARAVGIHAIRHTGDVAATRRALLEMVAPEGADGTN
ncbi:HAD superfamily hydrolase (TIGR01509 family) [Symbiobacterium terraclitae]|uniref:HAD superfamily hydrolase (TIGR01509 family) n=1 Tax=Symbiobacterium terraclitae TaxID=557451 RepID=A0ABS4JUT8_9FIRM|nr:HAD superfamily hydrolase (TIGR01509 family) [Symbiobacterium terraclitae]